ncbi:MAG: hypothetical protein IKS28_06365 [Clostridia bacterium]|nr:hypothetical protein [Clostridia bacterium]
MAGKNYEAPDLRIIGDEVRGGIIGEGSNTIPLEPSQLSFSVWKDVTGASHASYQDYVAWMNKHGYGEFIQDEKY